MEHGDIRNGLHSLGATTTLTGSRVLDNVDAVDWDYLVQGDVLKIEPYLKGLGFEREGAEQYADQTGVFSSWRKGDLNFLVTNDEDFAKRHRAATSLLRRFNLTKKADRVALFAAVLYGEASQ